MYFRKEQNKIVMGEAKGDGTVKTVYANLKTCGWVITNQETYRTRTCVITELTLEKYSLTN